jgi:predicted HTH domain antitoxin
MSTTLQHTPAFAVELPFNVTEEEARLALAIRLFEKGRVSLGQAARLAGFSKRAFLDVLGREGIPAVKYPPEELVQERDLDL